MYEAIVVKSDINWLHLTKVQWRCSNHAFAVDTINSNNLMSLLPRVHWEVNTVAAYMLSKFSKTFNKKTPFWVFLTPITNIWYQCQSVRLTCLTSLGSFYRDSLTLKRRNVAFEFWLSMNISSCAHDWPSISRPTSFWVFPFGPISALWICDLVSGHYVGESCLCLVM